MSECSSTKVIARSVRRLLTLEDTVEFFNLVLRLQLTEDEKRDLLAYLYTL